MRNTGPITNVDHPLSDDDVLISKTDAESYITYANHRFIEISGFDYAELYGEPHNLVRHPDIPEEVFADLWATLKRGRPWSGVLKNRRKNGDHYWVRAKVTPLREGDRVIGYASIRVKPSEEEVRFAEKVYADIREVGGRYAVRHGRVVRRGLRGRLTGWNRHGLAFPLGVIAALGLAMPVAIGGWASHALRQAGQADGAMQRIRETSQRLNDLIAEIGAAAREQDDGVQQISQAIAEIDRGIQASAATMHTYQESTHALNQEVSSLSHSAQAFGTPQAETAVRTLLQADAKPGKAAPGERRQAPALGAARDDGAWNTF